MTSIKNHKKETVLIAIAALAGLLVVSGHIALAHDEEGAVSGSGGITDTGTGVTGTATGIGTGVTGTATGVTGTATGVTGTATGIGTGVTGTATGIGTGTALTVDDSKAIDNKGINVPIDTDQKSDCKTVGGNSPISGSCDETSTNSNTQGGGVLTHNK